MINEEQLGRQAAPSPRPHKSKQPASATERIIRRLFGNEREFKTNLSLLSMSLPGVVLLFIFAYLPMLGIVIAFKGLSLQSGYFRQRMGWLSELSLSLWNGRRLSDYS